MSTNTVAQTIYQQLGGDRFQLMTGARALVGTPNSLRMQLPANLTKHRANSLEIVLLDDDTYSLRLQRRTSSFDVKELDFRTGIHVEQLHEAFTDLTGLAVTL